MCSIARPENYAVKTEAFDKLANQDILNMQRSCIEITQVNDPMVLYFVQITGTVDNASKTPIRITKIVRAKMIF